jgi:imidazolonepropionase-like amidohydrolase
LVYQVRGVTLPEREERTFWIEGDRLSTRPVNGADLVIDGGWLVPGLVDVHTHPGTEKPGDVFDDAVYRRHLIEHRDAGVLLIRTPGTAARIPDRLRDDPDLPRVMSAGPWLATPGRFFPGYGRDISEEQLAAAAVEEAKASSGWCKVIGDWTPDVPAVPLDLLRSVTQAVHAEGGRVAVHCQTAEGSRNAVLAGVDSLEHGMHLDPALLDEMATQGTVLVPTLSVLLPQIERLRSMPRGLRRDWKLAGCLAMTSLVRAAHEASVTVLAGTDTLPFGQVSGEVEWLIRSGLPAEVALGAASWTAREWLGLPGLVDGAPADLVAYPADPAKDPAVLCHPSRVILRGRVIEC